MQNQTPKKKTPYLLYSCLGIVLLLQVICIVGVAFYVPSVYNEIKYSYYINQAQTNFIQGNYQNAILAYTTAIESKPEDAYAYSYRAISYAKLNDFVNAKLDFEKSIQIDPLDGSLFNSYCWFGGLLGDAKNLLPICEKAVELEPENPSFRDSRGLVLALTGDYDSAIYDFQYFIALSDEYAYPPSFVADRVRWIDLLSQDINPFDAAELKRLLENEYQEEFFPEQDV